MFGKNYMIWSWRQTDTSSGDVRHK